MAPAGSVGPALNRRSPIITEDDDNIPGLVWDSPSEAAIRAVRKTPYTNIAEALRLREGQWARLPGEKATPESARNLAQNIRRGTMKDFPKGMFESVADGRYVFCRYVGPPSAETIAASREEEPGSDELPDDEGAPEGSPGGSAPEGEASRVDAAAIRAWAGQNGFDIKERGRLSPEVISAYNAREAANA